MYVSWNYMENVRCFDRTGSQIARQERRRRYRDKSYSRRLISTKGDIPWSARSPGLKILDYVKFVVYKGRSWRLRNKRIRRIPVQ